MTPAEVTLQRDFAIFASLCALRMTFSKHQLERDGATAAYEVALAHHQAWLAMSGRTAPGAA